MPTKVDQSFTQVQDLAEKAAEKMKDSPRHKPSNLYTDKDRVLPAEIDLFQTNALKDLNSLALPPPPVPVAPYGDQIKTLRTNLNNKLEAQFNKVVGGAENKESDWKDIVNDAQAELTKLGAEMKKNANPAQVTQIDQFLSRQMAELETIKNEKIQQDMGALKKSLENQKTNNDIADIADKAREIAVGLELTEVSQAKGTKKVWELHGQLDPEDVKELGPISFSTTDYERKLKNLVKGDVGIYQNPNKSGYLIKLDKTKDGRYQVFPASVKNIKGIYGVQEAYGDCIEFLMVKLQTKRVAINYDDPTTALKTESQVRELIQIMRQIQAPPRDGTPVILPEVREQLLSLKGSTMKKLVGEVFDIEKEAKKRELIGNSQPEMKENAEASIKQLKKEEPTREIIENEIKAAAGAPVDEIEVAKRDIVKVAATSDEKVAAVQTEIKRIDERLAHLSDASTRLNGQLGLMEKMAVSTPRDKFLDSDKHIMKMSELREQVEVELKDLNTRQQACNNILQEAKADTAPTTRLSLDGQIKVDSALIKLKDLSANSMTGSLKNVKTEHDIAKYKIDNYAHNIEDARVRAAGAEKKGIHRPGGAST